MNFRILLLAFVALFALRAPARLDTSFEKPESEATLIADTKAIEAGKPLTLGVLIKLDEGWHTYWHYVGDTALPTRVEWKLPPGFKAGPLQWPMPEAILFAGSLQQYGYEHEVLLMAEVTPPATLPAGEIKLAAIVNWQACKMQCIAHENVPVELTLPAGPAAKSDSADVFEKYRAQLPRTEKPSFEVEWTVEPKSVELELTGVPKDTFAEFLPIPSSPDAVVKHPWTTEPAADGKRAFLFQIKEGDATKVTWSGVLATRKGDGPREGWMITKPVADAAAPAPESPAPAATVSGSSPAPETRSAIAWLWAAFLGGLILNLMPCVLPVISLKIFGFINQAGENPRRVFQLGLAFCLGVVTFFLGLAVLLVALRSAGRDFIWGAQFGDPRLLIPVIALVVVFAMSMFGVFEITLGGAAENQLGALVRRDGFAGAFVHGLFTTLLGTSCTAPIVGTVLGSALSQPAPMVFAIFAAMAVGMSFPYLLLTSNPAWMRFLPKPGVWMERFKQFTGFVLLVVAVWLLGSLGHINGVEAMGAAGWFLVILALACWVFGAMHRGWLAALVALAIVGLAAKLFIPTALERRVEGGDATETTAVGNVWEPFSEERLATAIADGQPVFVDFTATWCANCHANEGAVLNTEAIAAAFKAKSVLLLRADYSSLPPNLTVWLKRYHKSGVPMYLLYTPGQAEPFVFPELLTRQMVLDRLDPIGV